MPFIFVVDKAFPLHENFMRPYPGSKTKNNIPNRIFNYRLSRVHQQVECAFGILLARFRIFGIFGRPLELQPPTVELLIKCTTVLHNYLRSKISFEEEVDNFQCFDFLDPGNQVIGLNSSHARLTH